MMRKCNPDPKEEYLRLKGSLHPHPEKIRDELFLTKEFFDPRDFVQVKYEMLRRHHTDNVSISKVVKQFGTNRVTFYQTAAKYEREGIPGLIPKTRGPKGSHKCTREIIQFVQERHTQIPEITWEALLREINEKFGVILHQRTVERGLARYGKKGRRSVRPKRHRKRVKKQR